MILSYQTIKKLCLEEEMISPFHERTVAHGMTFGCGPSGYDIRVAETEWISSGKFILCSSIEKFKMPNNLMATVKDKSTWARQGMSVFNTVIEAGWSGFLTLELVNHGIHPINLKKGMAIAQVVFEELDEPTQFPYRGKYDRQPAGPQKAIMEKESA